ncbi:hypothetical protein CIK76_18915 [Glutamicibacter sp. BW80]|nr:hypothetical protein CIK76_18915 [Glutamicibacter sp. BW80]
MNSINGSALDALFADQPAMLSVDEVATLLNASRQNVYSWLREGVIPGYKIGTTWRVLSEELKETLRVSQPGKPTAGGKSNG